MIQIFPITKTTTKECNSCDNPAGFEIRISKSNTNVTNAFVVKICHACLHDLRLEIQET